MQPVPIPSATAVVGVIIALMFMRRPGRALVAVALVGGAIVGCGIHLYVHVTGLSTLPHKCMLVHLLADTVRGIAVAIGVTLITILVIRALLLDTREESVGE